MFKLFGNANAKAAATAIHQLCHATRHARQTMGPKAGSGLLSKHPYLTSHREPSGPHDGHEFLLGLELEGFQFTVFDNRDMMQVSGSGDFKGFGLTTVPSGYHVYVAKPLSGPPGKHAKALRRIFVRHHGARDTSDLMS